MHWDVFVYGTLRQGFHNHQCLRGAVCLGPAATREPYAMYVAAGIPYLVKAEPRCVISGELYRVDGPILAGLDRLEEHPLVYCREEADIILADGRATRAWIYFARRPHGRLADTGDFAALP